MNKTTRLKRPQVPKPEEMFPFDNLTERPKYGGVQMTHETDIPHADTLRQEAAALVIAEANARDDADDALQDQIDDNKQGILDEADARIAADAVLQEEIEVIEASSDVKDIVGTKADLDAYDTSTLGDRDIIKVISDETHNDETTYYRWDKTNSVFELIGEEGPYYTQSAVDALLDDKADKTDTYTKTDVDDALAVRDGDIADINGKAVQAATDTTIGDNTEKLLTPAGVMRQWVDITQSGLPANPDANTFYYVVGQ